MFNPSNPLLRSPLPAFAWLVSLLLTPALAGATDALEARLDWGQHYRITAPVAGIVNTIKVQPGERVEQGAILFRLDTRRVQADLRAAQAAIERLQLERDEAAREVEKAEDLYDQTLIALREVELARIHHATVAARLTEAQAQRDRAQANRDDATVRAPATGRITRVYVTPGEYVNPALAPTTLAILGQDARMRAHARITADQIGRFPEGQAVQLTIGEHALEGSVAHVGWDPVEEENAQGYWMEVEFEPPIEALLRPGQSVHIELPDGS